MVTAPWLGRSLPQPVPTCSAEKCTVTVIPVTMALMATPRYRNLSISDLEWLVLEPLLRDRIAIASGKLPANAGKGSMVGMATWAKVSEAVSARIQEQACAGNFPVRLRGNDWDSGDIVWQLDVVATNRALATSEW